MTLSGRGDKDVEVVENYLKKNVKNKRMRRTKKWMLLQKR
ncbi:MAG: hypothetical protein YK1309IOTA_1920001 [Marine Group I thaumarchaeote]|nr:MAG: hypothetical protein YK1309IOTA_1920001 [Marine Group I thaumarchaeote]